MKLKLLACDVDGTLIPDHNQHISTSDLSAIQKFRKNGNLFVLCTGRTLVWTTPLIEKFNIQTDGLVLCNGSMIYQTNPNSPLDITEIGNHTIANKVGLEILEYFYHKKDFTLYWDDGKQTFEIQDRLLAKVSSIIQEDYSTHVTIEEALKSTSNFVTIGVTPMSANINIAEETKKEILSKWGDHVDSFRNQFFVDVAPKESSKGTGLKFLESHLQQEIELFGVGDSFNDLPMFQTVGKENAFFMANGDPSLAGFAHKTVKTVSECIDYILSR